MSPPSSSSISVALFCGGRGSASLIRAMLRWPNISLTLLVNAYDDGLSTGALRDFVPGMLGPSDFRKNTSYLLDLYSSGQYAMQRLIEYRFPEGPAREVETLERFATGGRARDVAGPLGAMLNELQSELDGEVRSLLSGFFEYADAAPSPFAYADCSFGNLLFTGAYLEEGSFNAATQRLSTLLRSRARLLNVSKGEARHLVALKRDGTLLATEAAVVGGQSDVPIAEYYFLESPVSPVEWASLPDADLAQKSAYLRSKEVPVEVAQEAASAIRDADVIVYGPGTQHSSLLPSYRIASNEILAARAPLKLFVVNLHQDHDVQELAATDLVDLALASMGDPKNERRAITHVLFSLPNAALADPVQLDEALLDSNGRYRDASVIICNFASPADPRVHSGHQFMTTLHQLLDRSRDADRRASVEVYVDLIDRSLALDGFLQEFLEIDWLERFESVQLSVNGLPVPESPEPSRLRLRSTDHRTGFTEVVALREWIEQGDSQYLVTLTGDGEYRLDDVIAGIELLEHGSFGALYGSRNQSRAQFRSSLRAAYGEGSVLYSASFVGALVLSMLFGVRFRVVFSDPLTGFRIYERTEVRDAFESSGRARGPKTPVSVTRLLVENGVEIAEMPVSYRTFAGFTRPRWRIARGLRNLVGFLK